MVSFIDKSVVITGSASGMGAASAREFAESGANVTIVDINENFKPGWNEFKNQIQMIN